MAEVKKNLQDKVKSLKRRRGSDPLPFKNALNGQLAELNQIMDFVKRLGNGSSEGRGLYDAMLAIPHVTASKQVWVRILKAWSLEAGLLGHLFLFFLVFAPCRVYTENERIRYITFSVWVWLLGKAWLNKAMYVGLEVLGVAWRRKI